MREFCQDFIEVGKNPTAIRLGQVLIICSISAIKWGKTTRPLLYILFSSVLTLCKMCPTMSKPREIRDFIPGNSAFHLIDITYGRELESAKGSRQMWLNNKTLPCLWTFLPVTSDRFLSATGKIPTPMIPRYFTPSLDYNFCFHWESPISLHTVCLRGSRGITKGRKINAKTVDLHFQYPNTI